MRAFLGLGANLGDRARALENARAAIEGIGARIIAMSSVYEADPVGGPDQPPYLNQVVEIETGADPAALLAATRAIEEALGRDRAAESERWGPRAIDIDILAFDDRTVSEPDLVVPHPRLAHRAFVLVPLAEIAPDFEVPGAGRVRDLLQALISTQSLRRI